MPNNLKNGGAFGFSVFVHNFVDFYLPFRYGVFKTKKYPNNRKVTEAVNRNLSGK
jgi:hypothetical protein